MFRCWACQNRPALFPIPAYLELADLDGFLPLPPSFLSFLPLTHCTYLLLSPFFPSPPLLPSSISFPPPLMPSSLPLSLPPPLTFPLSLTPIHSSYLFIFPTLFPSFLASCSFSSPSSLSPRLSPCGSNAMRTKGIILKSSQAQPINPLMLVIVSCSSHSS